MPTLYLGKQTIVKNNEWDFGNVDVFGVNSMNVEGNIISMPPDFESFGINWMDVSLNNRNYNSIATSSSGKYCSVTVTGGVIYNTADFGTTWSQSNNAPNANWKQITISANGKHQLVCIQNGGIMYSIDYGVNWSVSDAPTHNWSDITNSATGQYNSASVNDERIYYSHDYGITWVPSDAPIDDWKTISMTSKGDLQTVAS